MRLPAQKMIGWVLGVGTILGFGIGSPALEETNGNDVTALSYLVFATGDHQVSVSIDPELISELSRTQIQIPSAASRSGNDVDFTLLRPHGFVAVPVQLTPKLRVLFVTKPATAIYCAALGQFRLDDRLAARRALVPVGCSSCEFSIHCNELRETLDLLAERRRAVSEREQEIQQCRDRLNVARSGIMTGAAAQRSALNAMRCATSRMGADLAVSFVANCSSRLQEEIERSKSLNDLLLADVLACPQAIRPRLQRAALADLRGEEYYLVELEAAIFDHFRATRRLMSVDAHALPAATAGELPDDLATRRLELKRVVAAADACVLAGMKSLDAGDDEVALKQFCGAFATDRANPLARIGTGHCLLRKYGAKLDSSCPELLPREISSAMNSPPEGANASAKLASNSDRSTRY